MPVSLSADQWRDVSNVAAPWWIHLRRWKRRATKALPKLYRRITCGGQNTFGKREMPATTSTKTRVRPRVGKDGDYGSATYGHRRVGRLETWRRNYQHDCDFSGTLLDSWRTRRVDNMGKSPCHTVDLRVQPLRIDHTNARLRKTENRRARAGWARARRRSLSSTHAMRVRDSIRLPWIARGTRGIRRR